MNQAAGTQCEGSRRRRWLGFAGSLARGAETAFVRFPIASFAILAMTLLGNLAAAGFYVPDTRSFVWLMAALYGGGAASIFAMLLCEGRGLRKLVAHLLTLVVAVIAFVGIYFGGRAESHLPALTAAITLAIPLAPYLGQRDPHRFWAFGLWTTVGVTLAFLSVLLFVLGLSAILEMISFLFETIIGSQAYEHIYTTAFLLVGPLFAIGRIPHDFDEAIELGLDRMEASVRILIDWVAMPLVLATAFILHLYAAKIAVTATLPKNEIGWIVTFAALFVLTLRIAADPFLPDGAWPARIFARLWAYMLVVPLSLAVLAIAIRIDAEGVTLQRYYLALGFAAAILVVLAQLVPRLSGDTRVMAAIPVLLLGLSAFGPWGAASMVADSQVARLVSEFGVRVPGGEAIVIRAENEDADEQREMRSRIRALADADRLDRLRPYLEPDLAERLQAARRGEPENAASVVMSGLGIAVIPQMSVGRGFGAMRRAEIKIEGFDRAALDRTANAIEGDQADFGPAGGMSDGLSLVLDGEQLVARYGGKSVHFPLKAAIDRLPEELFESSTDQNVAPVLDLTDPDGPRLRLFVRRYIEGMDGDADFLTADVFYRSEDWPASVSSDRTPQGPTEADQNP
ncbi:DUF4153 domain-containing protein [Jiella marina]|uniref:DUF4153 domain-containing protein n=1 Tax=Jiella sp. LLJ827 TaxID=2917712 RepID=UPI0021014E2B|nr:DUF4153 domain-containing protein [Jiella sp. LLJ827]MCQ0987489.1 DUF4153 domain-containing protein [Jiella sp. LLJ827]